jgi:hypothetical protein
VSRSFAENGPDRGLLGGRDQVPVAFPHLLGLVPDPLVDQALVDPPGGAVADEAVPQDVPAAQHVPLATRQRPFEPRGGEGEAEQAAVAATPGLTQAERLRLWEERTDLSRATYYRRLKAAGKVPEA